MSYSKRSAASRLQKREGTPIQDVPWKECCANCKFSVKQADAWVVYGPRMVGCLRYPVTYPKYITEWCGEFQLNPTLKGK